MVPSSVISIGFGVFSDCTKLTVIAVDGANSVYSSWNGVLFNKSRSTLIQCPWGKSGSYAIPYGVTDIGSYAFTSCEGLTSIMIPDSVTSTGEEAFTYCTSLIGITIPGSVTNLGYGSFAFCTRLTSVYFKGSPPAGVNLFYGANYPTIYYLPGTPNWGATFSGRPTVQWNPQAQTGNASFGVGNNGFGFNITGSTNIPVVVEAATDFANPVWLPVGTNTLTNGSAYFSDPDWTNHPGRFYRLRSP